MEAWMMIEGVKKKMLVRHSDDRGYFMEMLRKDDDIFDEFGQVSLSKSYPGVIKAFHYHEKQDDIWFFPYGNAQVVLHDLRQESPTHRQTDVYYMGEDNAFLLFIPRGVAHGYRVLGQEPAYIMYVTNIAYNPKDPDEVRFPFDDPRIGFNWNTKNR